MDDEELVARVRNMTAECFGIVDTPTITLDASLADDLGATSLDFLELVSELETEFDIIIEESSFAAEKTFGDVVDCVRRCLAKK